MTFREALHIGSKAEGTIKCTYATIYDATGKGLFSLQREKASRGYEYRGGYSDGASMSDVDLVELNNGVWFNEGGTYRDTDIAGKVSYQLPMVRVTAESTDRLIPATLTAEAIDIITAALSKMKATKFTVWKVWKVDLPSGKAGRRVEVEHMYHLTSGKELYYHRLEDEYFRYEITSENVINPRYQALIDILRTKGTVYIKPAAFDWQALDVNNAVIEQIDTDGQKIEIKLSDALAQAKQKYEQAKAILAAAGAVAIF